MTAIEDTTILEVSTPQLDDVVRLEDAYGREGTSERVAGAFETCGSRRSLPNAALGGRAWHKKGNEVGTDTAHHSR